MMQLTRGRRISLMTLPARARVRLRHQLDRPKGFGAFRRVCHFHCQKTGGTAVNHAFHDLVYDHEEFEAFIRSHSDHPVFGDDQFRHASPRSKVHGRLNNTPGMILKGNGYVFTKEWRRLAIGDYSYGFGHHPFETMPHGRRTFTFTILRDPIARVISRYKMDLDASQLDRGLERYRRGYLRPSLKSPRSYMQLLAAEAPQHFQHQLYMFSNRFDVREAVRNASRLNLVIFNDQLVKGTRELSDALGVQLALQRVRAGKSKPTIDDKTRTFLRRALAKECEFYERVRELVASRGAQV